MALPLPNLDDRTYADLMEEARALIPTYDPSWTNHNPSDPGITLVELFAWLTEMLIYRANRVPDQHRIPFLKLLNGPEWRPGPDLAEDTRTSVVALRRRYRAVTCEDYEALAKEASPDVARVRCVSRRYLDAGTEADRTTPRPGHVSVIIVPCSTELAPQPSVQLRQIIWAYLDSRRVLTTRHHIVGPIYVRVSAEILIARRADVPEKELRDRVAGALARFLHPKDGGPDGDGWPFGRDVFVSELYELLEGVSGVDYVPDITLSSQCPPEARRCVAAAELWHEDGEVIGLDLAAHHLPQAQIDPSRIVIATAFVPVQVTIHVMPTSAVLPKDVRHAVKTAVKRFVHPLHGGPDGTEAGEITVAAIRTVVRELPVVQNVISIDLQSDVDHVLRDELGHVTGLRIRERELVDVQVTVVLP
jgi:Baseplate J-like protein